MAAAKARVRGKSFGTSLQGQSLGQGLKTGRSKDQRQGHSLYGVFASISNKEAVEDHNG